MTNIIQIETCHIFVSSYRNKIISFYIGKMEIACFTARKLPIQITLNWIPEQNIPPKY
jgi:hypothetical protein